MRIREQIVECRGNQHKSKNELQRILRTIVYARHHRSTNRAIARHYNTHVRMTKIISLCYRNRRSMKATTRPCHCYVQYMNVKRVMYMYGSEKEGVLEDMLYEALGSSCRSMRSIDSILKRV